MPVTFGLAMLASLFVLDRVGAAGFGWVVRHSDNRIARIYAGGRSDDVLVLGASVGNAMVLPPSLSAETGLSVFSMAVHGLDAVTQNALVTDYLALNAAPRVALIDIRTARTGLIKAPEFMLFAEDGNAIDTLNSEHAETVIPWAELFHLYRFNSPLLAGVLQRLVDRDDQESGPSDGRISKSIIDAWLRTADSGAVPSDQANAFAATIDAFLAAGTRPIIIVAPLHPSARFQAQDGIAEVSALIPRDVPICDFSELLNDDRDFEDPAHLNSTGRRNFLAVLAHLVEQGGMDLPDRSTDGPSSEGASGQMAKSCGTRPARTGT